MMTKEGYFGAKRRKRFKKWMLVYAGMTRGGGAAVVVGRRAKQRGRGNDEKWIYAFAGMTEG
jgi:hypothetical protein